MADQDRDALIRERAYRIWLEEGSPQGHADEHWHKAVAALDEEEAAVTPLHDLSDDPAPLLPPNR